MICRHQAAMLRKVNKGEGEAGSETFDESAGGGGGDSEERKKGEDPVGKLDQVQEDDGGEIRRVEMETEPRPAAGVEGDEGTEARDWARAGSSEQLNAAGAAPPAPDRRYGSAQGPSTRESLSGLLHNPKDYS